VDKYIDNPFTIHLQSKGYQPSYTTDVGQEKGNVNIHILLKRFFMDFQPFLNASSKSYRIAL
jgi:hypothetical protein